MKNATRYPFFCFTIGKVIRFYCTVLSRTDNRKLPRVSISLAQPEDSQDNFASRSIPFYRPLAIKGKQTT